MVGKESSDLDIKQAIIKQVIKNNSFTLGLLNKFIGIAKSRNSKSSEFYSQNLDKVLNIRRDLLDREIVLKELEEIFEN